MNLRSLGEFGLIDRIAGRVAAGTGIIRGIGDDAAAVKPSPGTVQLLTSDMLLEGVHFDLTFTSPEALGRKSLAVNLSDMAAMGGRSRHFLLSLAIPPSVSLEFLDPFIGGLLDMASCHAVSLVGGDTCASRSGLVISITLVGEQLPERVVYRQGARPGDLVCVTGFLGDSALGLAELRAGLRETPAVSRHLEPSPRCNEGLMLAEAGLPTAMIDVSDGLLADLGHILECSGVGAKVFLDRLPLSEYFSAEAGRLVSEPIQLALAGGEDYELLFSLPRQYLPQARQLLSARGIGCAVIGEVTEEAGLQVTAPDGSSYQPTGLGFSHF
ncbi:MAG: thiamine-phosphate kinase [Geobacter sp.]|nr:thiamine-phosphate kinase [Geobacter sp.]